ncbi:hypothetical protein CK203_017123 [Vitis vinifera]|uniref:Uncharacterized protein n=1 Tax=Vitis vinifera TaxID=29760 RepID=A0A438JZM8_VITVI|nr:hypothetical protein CK203_017123 [Vitis vinifera]
MALTANEAIASRLKSSINGELDIKKINDHVKLGILVVVLEQMGFGSKSIQYIKWCITIAHFSILGQEREASLESSRVSQLVEEVSLRIEKFQKDFLQGGGALESKPHLLSWSTVCRDERNRSLDNRQRVEFWKDRWCGNSSLDESFPKLLSIASAKDTWLVEIWEQEGEGGCSNHASQDISMTKSSSK